MSRPHRAAVRAALPGRTTRNRLRAAKRLSRQAARGFRVGFHGGSPATCPYSEPDKRERWLSGWAQGQQRREDHASGKAR